MVDTGATVSVAPAGLATALGLGPSLGSPVSLSGVGGGLSAVVYTLDIQVGNQVFPNIPVAVAQTDQVPFLLGRAGFWPEASLGFDNSRAALTITPLDGQQAALTGTSPPPQATGAFALLALFAVAVGAYFVLAR